MLRFPRLRRPQLGPERLTPLIVAVAMFMENMDSNVIATSLPMIAGDLGTDPLTMKLAVTSYLLALAVFIPASGWTADRFGARNVFRIAIGIFIVGSILCATSYNLPQFIGGRIVQGAGGAMMTPVARLLLLRTIDKRSLVDAMAWLTIPALVGPLVGPPLGGFITTYFAWHWIFTINVPIGILGIILVTRFIEDVRSDAFDPLDFTGIVLAGIAVAGLAFGLSVAGLGILRWEWLTTLLVVGTIAAVAYALHARRVARPALDFSLLREPTFRASVTGGSIFRIGVGAIPFLVPLLMQLGFGLSPFQSGLITFAGAAGALTMKALAARILRRYGFRRVLVVNSLLGAAFIAAGALFVPGVPFAFIIVVLLIGGFFRSLQFTSIGTIAYADLAPEQMSRGTTLSSVAQQVSLSAGVAVGALMVDVTLRWRGLSEITAEAFPPAFLVVGAISALSVFAFVRLPANAGESMSGRRTGD